jgi:predicted nuclease of predicted toxin-antitoxin system
LVPVLAKLGHDIETVRREELIGASDSQVWEVVVREERFLLTQDMDFSDARRFGPGSHPGLMVLRLKTPGRLALARRVESIFKNEPVESWHGCFVIATAWKIRVVRAPKRIGGRR